MSIQTSTHLNFRGDARAALEFYASVFGGTASLTTYAELGMPADLPDADAVVFGLVHSESGFAVMAYDILGEQGEGIAGGGSTRRENGATLTDQAFFIAVNGQTLDEVRGYWNALTVGGTVVEPLAASAWSAGFGMLTDRFGVTWTLGVITA